MIGWVTISYRKRMSYEASLTRAALLVYSYYKCVNVCTHIEIIVQRRRETTSPRNAASMDYQSFLISHRSDGSFFSSKLRVVSMLGNFSYAYCTASKKAHKNCAWRDNSVNLLLRTVCERTQFITIYTAILGVTFFLNKKVIPFHVKKERCWLRK